MTGVQTCALPISPRPVDNPRQSARLLLAELGLARWRGCMLDQQIGYRPQPAVEQQRDDKDAQKMQSMG